MVVVLGKQAEAESSPLSSLWLHSSASMQGVEQEVVEVVACQALIPHREQTLPRQTMAGGPSPSSSSDVIKNILA